MAFSNKSIDPPRIRKPHICIREGRWRVSFLSKENLRRRLWRRWDEAHHFAQKQERSRNARLP